MWYSRLSFFPPSLPLSRPYSHFLQASRFSLSAHTHIPLSPPLPPPVCITIPRVFFYLRFAIYEGMARIFHSHHPPSPRLALYLPIRSSFSHRSFHFSLYLSLSLSVWVVHTVIASLLKFKRDSPTILFARSPLFTPAILYRAY